MRRLSAWLILALLTLTTWVALPSAAFAQSTVAVTQFKEAKKLYEEEKYEDALQLFQLAWEHSHSPNARLFIARCFKKLGKNKPAYDEFRGTLRDATERLDGGLAREIELRLVCRLRREDPDLVPVTPPLLRDLPQHRGIGGRVRPEVAMDEEELHGGDADGVRLSIGA